VSRTISEPGLLVLASLVSEPKHGYAIISDVERHSGKKLGPGTLYGIIARLERDGLIVALERGDRGRTPYRVTAAGRRVFEHQLASLKSYRRALRALSAR
jgi:DNA-binding PadR family transcriptional regulator